MDIATLEPQTVWQNFIALNAIPRASKKEAEVIAFMKQFGIDLALETHIDKIGNVIIKKPATKGFEQRSTLILQAHLDMVHQKNTTTVFDFNTQGINMLVDGDWVRADGTTLGADNGIGVAMIMSILASDTIEHPPLEALFTIDEETGMTGAKHLDTSLLSGKILLNLDTEEDDEIDVGCAGGIDTTITGTYDQQSPAADTEAFEIALTGLKGGHSGMEIHLELGNANKLMNRLLRELSATVEIGISAISGGGLRNAIPRESFAKIVIKQDEKQLFLSTLTEITQRIKTEYKNTAPKLAIAHKSIERPEKIMQPAAQNKLLQAITACFDGVFKMSTDIAGLVETSSNLAKIGLQNGAFELQSLQRSSVETAKMEVAQTVAAPFYLLGFEVVHSGSYPGWKPEMEASVLKLAVEIYQKLFGEKPKVVACHAGLECGLLKEHLPDTQMISFGPTIQGAHSPEERVSISSVQKFWRYLLQILSEIA